MKKSSKESSSESKLNFQIFDYAQKHILFLIAERAVAEIFKILLLTYVGMFILESFSPAFVSNFISMRASLALLVSVGVMLSMFHSFSKKRNNTGIRKGDIRALLFASIIVTSTVYYQLASINLNLLAVSISLISGLVIMLVGILLLVDGN